MLTRACTLALVAFSFAGEAAASELIGRDGGRAGLQVNGAGQAHVTCPRTASPGTLSPGMRSTHAGPGRVPQVSFQLRYGRRSSSRRRGGYDGPPLAWVVAACKASDGSYWALQRWQRLKPNDGGKRGEWEVRPSHWSGAVPVLRALTDWAYRRFDHLYGRSPTRGSPCTASR